MARKPSRNTMPDRFVCIKNRNVYDYNEQLAQRRDAAVVNGGQAAAVLISRGMDDHPIAKAFEKDAQKYLESLEFGDGSRGKEIVDGETVLQNADAVIDTRRKAPSKSAPSEQEDDLDSLFGERADGEFGEASA